MTEIMTWNYAGEADITYGEVHVSPVAKILLAISLIFIAASAVSAIVFKDNIYDFIANPRIVLLNTVKLSDANGAKIDVAIRYDDAKGEYFVDIPHDCKDFDPDTLIDSKMYKDKDEYEYVKDKINGKVDSSKIDTYQVKYISHNSVKSNVTTLNVNVKDMTPPNITFKENPILLVRGAKTDSFKVEDYINISDDYSDIDKINLTHDGEFDFGSEGTTSTTVKYYATDEAGNDSKVVSLSIVITDDFEAAQKEIDRLTSSVNNSINNGNDNSNSGNRSSTATSSAVTFRADPITWSISQDGPVTSLATNPKGIIYSSNSGSAWPIDGPGYTSQVDEPGVYTRTWECSEGLTVTQQVTITE